MRIKLLKSLPVILAAGLLALPAVAVGEEGGRPRKLFNLNLAAGWSGLEGLVEDGDRTLISDPNRFVVQLGLEYGQFPWMLECNFYTTVSGEIYGGFYWPAVKLRRGWLVFTLGALFKFGREEFRVMQQVEQVPPGTDRGAEPSVKTVANDYYDIAWSLGAGLSVEYVFLDGYMGLYVEAKQSFFRLVETTVVAGFNISPLILLWLRDR
jgi:hypothetical protein